MFIVRAFRNRTITFSGTLKTASGGVLQLANSDKVRIKVGRQSDGTPILDLLSGTATTNGSLVTITSRGSSSASAKYEFKLAQGDTKNMEPGTYDMEVLVVDDSETSPADAVKMAEQGALMLRETLDGGVGL